MEKNKKKTPFNTIGKMISEAREEKGLTCIELARKIGDSQVDEETVRDWEKGKVIPNLDMMYKLSGILELNPTVLLNTRNTIQEESYSEPNWAARRIGGRILDFAKPGFNLTLRLLVGICLIYLAVSFKQMENINFGGDQKQVNFIADTIQNQIDMYVPTNTRISNNKDTAKNVATTNNIVNETEGKNTEENIIAKNNTIKQ